MEENMVVNGQELVDAAYQKVEEAAAELDKKIAETGLQATTNLPAAVPVSQTKSFTGKNLAVGAGLIVGGGALGFALDHWGLPWLNKRIEAHKAKKAEKKAARAAKKAAKSKDKKPSEPAAANNGAEVKSEPAEPGTDPTTIDTKIN